MLHLCRRSLRNDLERDGMGRNAAGYLLPLERVVDIDGVLLGATNEINTIKDIEIGSYVIEESKRVALL